MLEKLSCGIQIYIYIYEVCIVYSVYIYIYLHIHGSQIYRTASRVNTLLTGTVHTNKTPVKPDIPT